MVSSNDDILGLDNRKEKLKKQFFHLESVFEKN